VLKILINYATSFKKVALCLSALFMYRAYYGEMKGKNIKPHDEVLIYKING
jgi:hypothetical protein